MADLGAIGTKYVDEAVRLVPMSLTAPTGAATLLDNPLSRVIFDCADASSVAKNFPRAMVLDYTKIGGSMTALYPATQLQIRGTVKNSAGTGIARLVLIINREGVCVGKTRSASDGTFSVTLVNQGFSPVLCAAIPEDADLRNAVVKWKVVPVVQA